MRLIDFNSGFHTFCGMWTKPLRCIYAPIRRYRIVPSYTLEKGLYVDVRYGYDKIIVSVRLPSLKLDIYHSIKFALELSKHSLANNYPVVVVTSDGGILEAIMRLSEHLKQEEYFKWYEISPTGIIDRNGIDADGLPEKIKLFEPISLAHQRLICEPLENY